MIILFYLINKTFQSQLKFEISILVVVFILLILGELTVKASKLEPHYEPTWSIKTGIPTMGTPW